MIKQRIPLSMIETKEIMKEAGAEAPELEVFLNKFSNLESKDVDKMFEELQTLDLLKINREQMVKIADLLPEDAVDFNKFFNDTSLDEDEQNKILDVVKKYK